MNWIHSSKRLNILKTRIKSSIREHGHFEDDQCHQLRINNDDTGISQNQMNHAVHRLESTERKNKSHRITNQTSAGNFTNLKQAAGFFYVDRRSYGVNRKKTKKNCNTVASQRSSLLYVLVYRQKGTTQYSTSQHSSSASR